jgi:hypothetical protein
MGAWLTGCWKPAIPWSHPTPCPQGLAARPEPAGAKSEPGGAALLADYLRCLQHRLRVLRPFSAHTRALRAVVRTCDDLVD